MQMTPAKMLSTAIFLSAEGHLDQTDKGGNPYILHPLKVMYYVGLEDFELASIAVLHDYIEDCKKKGATYKKLESLGFSKRVIEGVRCITRVPGEEEEEYEARLMSNIDSMRVKLKDIRHNSDVRRLKGVEEKDIARLRKYHILFIKLTKAIADWKDPTV